MICLTLLRDQTRVGDVEAKGLIPERLLWKQ